VYFNKTRPDLGQVRRLGDEREDLIGLGGDHDALLDDCHDIASTGGLGSDYRTAHVGPAVTVTNGRGFESDQVAHAYSSALHAAEAPVVSSRDLGTALANA
jgi:hypothetical protein